jgi:calcineurin-like phosphoesterase family protein
MTQLFITSDEHIGHAKIIELAHRPFASLDEMKETIITNHNKKVPRSLGVLTVHVGDWLWNNMTYLEAWEYISQLNGRHAFMFGNHDELVEKYRDQFRGGLDFIVGENKAGGAKIFNYNKMKVTVDHFAHRVWEGSHKGHGHVYGHSHSALPGLGRSFDIGVDGNDFTPWAIEEVVAKLEKIPPHHTVNNTGEGMTEDTVAEGPSDAGQTVHFHPVGETCGFCRVKARPYRGPLLESGGQSENFIYRYDPRHQFI